VCVCACVCVCVCVTSCPAASSNGVVPLGVAGVRSGGELGDCLGDGLVPVWDPDLDAGSGCREGGRYD